MEPFEKLSGVAAPLMRRNVDTDIITPMARIVGGPIEDLGKYAFEPWRFRDDGSENPEFVLNHAPFRDAPILLAGDNFACGSSRETAVWGLQQLGIRCVIAPSFGDIFHNNCFKNGMLPIRLPEETVENLARQASGGNARFTVDLEACVVIAPDGTEIPFEVGAGEREMLLLGLDEVGMTLRREEEIADYQNRDREARPWIYAISDAKPRKET